jgi:hypothetical protein
VLLKYSWHFLLAVKLVAWGRYGKPHSNALPRKRNVRFTTRISGPAERFARPAHLMFATGAAFINDTLDVGLRLASALLDAADQFIFLAFHELQVIVRQLRIFLLQLAFGDVPSAFHFKSAHNF